MLRGINWCSQLILLGEDSWDTKGGKLSGKVAQTWQEEERGFLNLSGKGSKEPSCDSWSLEPVAQGEPSHLEESPRGILG